MESPYYEMIHDFEEENRLFQSGYIKGYHDAMIKGTQEAVKPKYNARTNWYECGACHYSMTSGMHCRSELIPAYKVGFCARCGRAVKWDG